MTNTDLDANEFTHFQSTEDDLPPEVYSILGHALYRWSQLECTVCLISVLTMHLPFLEAMGRLRGTNGFKVKNIFQQLQAMLSRSGANSEMIETVAFAERLYTTRKELFHSVWGFVTNARTKAVGIQEWSNSEYSNFRSVSYGELEQFGEDCKTTNKKLMQTVIPHLHGTEAVVVSD